MKILGLVASPRIRGNSEILVKEMLASLPETFQKEMIRLDSLKINPCKACYACLSEESQCVVEDDLAFLLQKIKEADAVIIASACYFLGSHTSIKKIGDRLVSILANQRLFAGKKCVTAVVYGIPGWDGYAREAVNNFAHFLHLDLVGNMVVKAASPGEVIRPEILQEARALAASVVIPGKQQNLTIPGVLTCQGCGSSLLQIQESGQVRCVMCGTEGELSSNDKTYEIHTVKDKPIRYSQQGMDEHTRKLEDVKKSYIANRNELFALRKKYDSYDWWIKRDGW